MKRLSDLAPVAAALTLAACGASAGSLQSALSACASGAAHTEVYIPDAIVTRVLGERESRSGMHEGFIVRAGDRTFKVEDNVEITGPIPLRRGEAVSLLGQLECNDDVIHWTHHDPSGRHATGYVKAGGRTYE